MFWYNCILCAVQIVIVLTLIPFFYILWQYLKTTRSPAQIHLKAMLLVSIPGVFIGCPIFALLVAKDYQTNSLIVCNLSKATIYTTYTFSSLSMLYLLALMVIHRYLYFKKDHSSLFIRYKMYFICITLSIPTIISIPIAYNAFKDNFAFHCGIVCEYKLGYTYDREKWMSCNKVGIILIAVSITICTLVISTTTYLLRRYICKHNQVTCVTFGISRSINLRRIDATHYLLTSLVMFWLPWGICRAIVPHTIDDISIQYYIYDTFQILSSTVFLSLPVIHLKMDGAFRKYFNKQISRLFKNDYVTKDIKMEKYVKRDKLF